MRLREQKQSEDRHVIATRLKLKALTVFLPWLGVIFSFCIWGEWSHWKAIVLWLGFSLGLGSPPGWPRDRALTDKGCGGGWVLFIWRVFVVLDAFLPLGTFIFPVQTCTGSLGIRIQTEEYTFLVSSELDFATCV